MRSEGDSRPDHVIKREIVFDYFIKKQSGNSVGIVLSLKVLLAT